MNQEEEYFSSLSDSNTETTPRTSYAQSLPQNNHLWMEQMEYTAQLGNGHKIIVGSNGAV